MWANFLLGFEATGAGVAATPIFLSKMAPKIEMETKCHNIDFTPAIDK